MTIKLSRGAHASPQEGACVMELAAYLTNDKWTDLPQCTNAMIGRFAQGAWDSQAEADLAQVARDFLPRLLRAKRTSNDAEINRKLRRFCVERAVVSAKSVQHLARDQERAAERIKAAEDWLASGAKPAAAADAAADAAAAAYAAAYAYADGEPLGLAASRLKLLDELLDYHEKLLVEAGEYLWQPKAWEEEALAFVDSLA